MFSYLIRSHVEVYNNHVVIIVGISRRQLWYINAFLCTVCSPANDILDTNFLDYV